MGQTKPDLPRSQERVHFANAMLDWAATLPGLTRRLLTISIMQGLARRLYGGEAQGPCSPARDGARETFTTRLGYVDRRHAADLARSIAQSAEGA